MMKKTFLLFLLIFCSLAFCQTYKVIGIKDGDTVSLLMDGKKQPYGTKAKDMISVLCFGKMVSLKGDGKRDRNGRLIAELLLPNGINVNKTLVKAGLAWHFKKYSKDEIYAQLEIEARNKKVGLWKDKTPVSPWNWRKMKKEEKAINSVAF
mgnify:CR=1 FL=1